MPEAARARNVAGHAIPRLRDDEQLLPFAGELVVPPRRPLFGARGLGIFPGGAHQAFLFEAAEHRVHRPARQARGIHDVEAMMVTAGQRLKDERRWQGYIHLPDSTYVEF